MPVRPLRDEVRMEEFTAILANRYGETLPPSLRGPMALVGLAVGIICIVLWAANRKKLEEFDKSSGSNDATPTAARSPWKCPKCGEQLEPQFTTCWKCGTPREK
jgi:hypothetical protein